MDKQTGLVIIDIQNNYFNGGVSELHQPEKAAGAGQFQSSDGRIQTRPDPE